jgi:predicted dehydrogenase
MSESVNRRQFLGAAGAAGVVLGAQAQLAVAQANNRLVVGVMGTGGRGTGLARAFAGQKDVEVAYVCDADKKRADAAADAVAKLKGKTPQAVLDFRKILDDKAVDILVIATCNHWHAPAAILACTAGKHVYVEKPCSYTPLEGEMMVAAARKNKRHVQMGNQRRSWTMTIEAIQQVRDGAIGRAYLAESWYTNNRPSIGKGKAVAVPAGLDYELWQGPAPRRPFHDNYLHYNWHWFWHWGNGELGNNGVHTIDLCRWGLGVDYPVLVSSTGGRYRFEDDQETPDTNTVTYDFADRKSIRWTGWSCNQVPGGKIAHTIFQGETGSLALTDSGYTVHDTKGKEVKAVKGSGSDAAHIGNLLEAVRSNARLTSEIEEAHKSTLLCHLGNISYRTKRTLRCDPKNGHILDDKEAAKQWTREYERGFEPKV